MLKDIVKKSRSYRVFDESYKLEKQALVDLIEQLDFHLVVKMDNI